MALQTKTITANGGNKHHKFTLTVIEESTNEYNYSFVTWKFAISPIKNNYDWSYSNTVPVTYSINVGGHTYNGNIMKYDGTSTITLAVSENRPILHNADGTKAISCSFSVSDIGKSFMPGACSASATMTLTDIPRGATLVSVSQFYDDQSPVITYSNPAGNSVSSLEIAMFDEDGATEIFPYRTITNKTGTSYTFEISEANSETLWSTILKGARLGSPVFRLKSVINGQSFYSDFTSAVEIRNSKPVITSINLRDTLEAAIALTGSNQTIIKGYNSIVGTITAEGRKGAEITMYKTVNGNNIGWANSNRFNNTENPAFTFTIADDRQLTTIETRTLNMIDYFAPTCVLKTSWAMEAETTARITLEVSGNSFTGSFGAKNNVISVSYRYKTNSGEYGDWISVDSSKINASNGRYTAITTIDIDYRDTCSIEASVYDLVITGGVYSPAAIVKIIPVFDWSDADFNFNVPVSINGVEIDYIVEQGTKNGWFYRKWNSGRGECWKTVTLNTAANTAWGALWKGSFTERQNYPFVFTSKPVEQVTLQSGAYGAMVIPADNGDGVNGAYASARYTVCRPASTSSAEYYLSICAYGTWR